MPTTNLGLDIPVVGTGGYAPKVNAAMQRIDDAAAVFAGLPAAGSASGKDKAAVAAAYAAALAKPQCGVLKLGPGRYDVSDIASLILPKYGAGPTIKIQGDAFLGTELFFSVDRGLGTYGISLGALETDLYYHTIENVRLVGPGTGGAKGSPPVNTIGGGATGMNGVQLGSRMKIHHGASYGFRSGVVAFGNHLEMRSWLCQSNYDALLFANAYTNAGDVLIDNCDLSGNNRASISITNASVASFQMVKGHLGFSPYAVYFEAGRTAGSGLAMGGCVFSQTSFEQIGNCFFYDPDQMARCQTLTFIQTGNYARGFAAYGIAAQTDNPGFRVRDWQFVNFIDGFPPGVTDGALFDVTNILSMETNVWKASFDASVTAGKSWILFGTAGTAPQVYLRERSNWRAVAAQNDTTAAIAAGQVLELGGATNGFRPWRQYAGVNTGLLAGVALNAVSTSTRELCVCVKESYSVPVLVDSAPASAYQIVGSTVTIGKATGVVYDGTTTSLGGKPLIGQSVVGAIPTGASLTNCKICVP